MLGNLHLTTACGGASPQGEAFERMVTMWIVTLILTILNLIFVYKNKAFASKILAVVTTILYCILSWNDILNLIIMIQSGFAGAVVLIWDIVSVLLLASLCISVFKGKRIMSLFLLWILIAVLLLSNWNTWFTYIIYFKRLLN